MRTIVLKDIDEPERTMHAILLRHEGVSIALRVPGTTVFFSLRRSGEGDAFSGSLGGRRFFWEAEAGDHFSKNETPADLTERAVR
jgi:hypothetical protein